MPIVHYLDTLWVETFDEIALSRKVKEIKTNLQFSIIGENSNWPPFLGRGKFFENCQESIALIPYGSKISRKSLYSDGLGDRHIDVFCYVAITQEIKAIATNNNSKQAIDAINLHTKF